MINRLIFSKLQDEISRPEIIILLGPRQVGKTTLLKMLDQHCREKGYRTHFFDLEQPQSLAEFNRPDEEIISKILSSGEIIFIDEFQYLQNASKLFKAIYDSGHKIKIFCSGSSSLEIHRHLKESLAGRRFLFRIYPLLFSELTAWDPAFQLSDYMVYGGMPALSSAETTEKKQQILADLLSSYILKDVKALVKEENIRAFNHLLYLLAERQGSTVSVHSLGNQVNLSSKAVERYLSILEATYVCYRLHSYSRNMGNELKKSCKFYLYDTGIRNSLLKDFSDLETRDDKGVLHETFVFLQLQACLAPNMEIKFWRTKEGDEVDFILLKDRKPVPIEVKSSYDPQDIPRGMKKFLNRYGQVETGYIVSETAEGKLKYNDTLLNFVTFKNLEKISFY